MLHTVHLNTPAERDAFLQEARFLDQLKHPFILSLFDVGIHQEALPYLIMEYAASGSLRKRLDSQPSHRLPFEESLTILSQIGQALQYAHRASLAIIHRDLKPENILFNQRGEALLADFGIATILSAASVRLTSATGTPAYMAPEQFHGQVSRESDQYALGCVAYELLTGQRPFTAPILWPWPSNMPPKSPSHQRNTIPTCLLMWKTLCSRPWRSSVKIVTQM